MCKEGWGGEMSFLRDKKKLWMTWKWNSGEWSERWREEGSGEIKKAWLGGCEGWTVWMRGKTDLIFLGLVRGGHVSQILDHLLGVLCLTSSRLSSVRRDTESKRTQRRRRFILTSPWCLCAVWNSRAKNGLVFTICRKRNANVYCTTFCRTSTLHARPTLSPQCIQQEVHCPQTGNLYPASCDWKEVLLGGWLTN